MWREREEKRILLIKIIGFKFRKLNKTQKKIVCFWVKIHVQKIKNKKIKRDEILRLELIYLKKSK